ncbi:transcriptional activator FtrB [compost metagenome]
MISFLLEQAAQQASEVIRLPFSRKEWAEHLNTARPSLSREMGYLRDIGWIHFKGSSITLLNMMAMNDYIRTVPSAPGQDK